MSYEDHSHPLKILDRDGNLLNGERREKDVRRLSLLFRPKLDIIGVPYQC